MDFLLCAGGLAAQLFDLHEKACGARAHRHLRCSTLHRLRECAPRPRGQSFDGTGTRCQQRKYVRWAGDMAVHGRQGWRKRWRTARRGVPGPEAAFSRLAVLQLPWPVARPRPASGLIWHAHAAARCRAVLTFRDRETVGLPSACWELMPSRLRLPSWHYPRRRRTADSIHAPSVRLLQTPDPLPCPRYQKPGRIGGARGVMAPRVCSTTSEALSGDLTPHSKMSVLHEPIQVANASMSTCAAQSTPTHPSPVMHRHAAIWMAITWSLETA